MSTESAGQGPVDRVVRHGAEAKERNADMKHDELMRLAGECGAEVASYFNYHHDNICALFSDPYALVMFAQRIEAAERERCATVLQMLGQDTAAAIVRAQGMPQVGA